MSSVGTKHPAVGAKLTLVASKFPTVTSDLSSVFFESPSGESVPSAVYFVAPLKEVAGTEEENERIEGKMVPSKDDRKWTAVRSKTSKGKSARPLGENHSSAVRTRIPSGGAKFTAVFCEPP